MLKVMRIVIQRVVAGPKSIRKVFVPAIMVICRIKSSAIFYDEMMKFRSKSSEH